MDSYVVKVQNKGSLRRLTLAGGELGFSFERLQSRIRELFQLPAVAQFGLTYVDKDGDVVTMAEDEDLRDALVVQSLNPLRVTIENVQEGRTDDGVKTSSPILQTEANAGEVTEQQKQGSQGEAIPAQSESESSLADAVATAEPVSDSGKISAVAEEKASTIDGVPDSNPADVFPATPGAVEDAKENSPDGEAKGNGTPEAEVAEEELGHQIHHQIHLGIKCDGCGMVPLQGPRFQSLKKSNYDLCLKCFEASDAVDYEYAKINGLAVYTERMCRRPDRGMWRKNHPRPSTTDNSGLKNVTSAGAAGVAQGENKTAADSSTRVLHQGVQCDECGMAPIEGPRFNSTTRYNYDLCRSCFEKSGGNASEYRRLDQPFVRGGHPMMFRPLNRLASPRVRRWAMISNQIVPIFVVPSAGAEEEQTAAAGGDVKVGEHPVKIPLAESAATEGNTSATPAAQAEAAVTKTSDSKQDLGTTEERGVDAKAGKNVVDIPVIFSTEETEAQTPARVDNVPSTENGTANISKEAAEETNVGEPVAVEGESSTKEDLAAKLATMGFEDSKLNAELLEKNNFDLRKTVDDLCAAEEWDPILGELQEMGFYDANMNRRLMFKNNGSVKRVVKELVQMYREKKA